MLESFKWDQKPKPVNLSSILDCVKNTLIFIANPVGKRAVLRHFFPNKICLKHKTFFVGEGILLLLRVLLHFK